MSYAERGSRVPAPSDEPESAKPRRQRVWLTGACSALLTFVAFANVCSASPPFINMLYPPAGITAPHEDAAAPHALPPYPAHAAACKETGEVKLQFTIGADGGVSDVQIVSSSGFSDLDVSALTTARRWHYIPAKKADAPVAVRIATSIDFPPDDKAPNFSADCTPEGMRAAVDAIVGR